MLDDEHAGKFTSLVGSLLYIPLDRWDLAFAVKSLASFLKSPTKASWIALSKVIGYLLAVPELSFIATKVLPWKHCISNYGACREWQKSNEGRQ